MDTPPDEGPLTPVEELFTYHIFGLPDAAGRYQADPASYRLSVGGCVGTPLELDLNELQTGFPQQEAVMVLQCMSWTHWGRLAVRGPRLWDVLQRAGVNEEACKLAFHGADGYDTDLPLAEVRNRPDAFLLAHSMNGEPLDLEHGFPLRLASRGKYAYKWPKWIERIEAVTTDYQGHYEGKRGWSDRATRGEPVT